jgi:retron-type reverse transcriptase
MLPHQRKKIRAKYSEIHDLEDFLSLLLLVNRMLYGETAQDIKLKSLTFYSNPKIRGIVYEKFKVPKKSGGYRTIHSPASGLKSIQRAIAHILQSVFDPNPNATGFVLDKSVVDNAKPHTGKNFVFNIDLKDFFSSIDKPRFWKRLHYPPFDLNEETGRLELANRITAICFTELEVERKVEGQWQKQTKDVLPQGAPTSPVITNIICYRLDEKLSSLAKKFGCTYTRYADDITFSSDHNIYEKAGDFRTELSKLIEQENFYIQKKKTRLHTKTERQEVTGLTVNEKVNVNRRYIKQLRHWIYFWERYGQEKAEQLILNNYRVDKGHIKKGEPNIENIISGKLLYLKMVKGPNNRCYKKLQHRFDVLLGQAVDFDPDKLFEIWNANGIEAAMEYYYE